MSGPNRGTWHLWVCAFTALLPTQLAPSLAAAATAHERTLAEILFREARALMEEQRFEEACPKFAESQRLDPGGGTLLNLALCHENQGKLVTAWTEYREALAQARSDGRADRIAFAEARIAELEPRLPRLELELPKDLAEWTLQLDGEDLPRATWSAQIPIDPGPHEIRAVAPGKRAETREVTLAEGQVAIARFGTLQDAPPEAHDARLARSVPEDGGARMDSSSSRRQAGYVAGGLGLTAVGLGTFFGIRAIDLRGQSDEQCPNERCNREGVRLNESAKLNARLSNIAFGVGLVGLGVGAYLILSSTPESNTELGVGTDPELGSPELRVRHVW